MSELFTSIGHVEIDGDRMRLVGNAPQVNGVYAWVFDKQLQYIGVANRAKGGLHARLSMYLRRATHVSFGTRKDGKSGTTTAMRDAIRSRVEAGGEVKVMVVPVDEIPEGDLAEFEKRAIQELRPPRNKVHRN